MTDRGPRPQRSVDRLTRSKFEPGHVDGHLARRLIDPDEAVRNDPFLIMAEDVMPHGAFGQHPHRGLETVTLVLDGAVEHYDSAGHKGVIEAGDAQWMTAGRGVIHNESSLPGTTARTLQLWINLPADQKMASPRYQYLQGGALPCRHLAGVEVRVLSGRSGDTASTTRNHVPVTALDMRLASNATFQQALEPGDNAFVLVLDGSAEVGASATTVSAGELAWLSRDDGDLGSDVTIATDQGPCRALLFSGRPLNEPIAFGGPFVMNTDAEIQQAFVDYRAGRF